MLLQRLREYSERLELPPSMYGKTRIRWLIDLNERGHLIGFVATTGERKASERGMTLLAPHVQRTVAIRPKLLADNGEYVLGVAREPEKQERVDKAHAAFVDLIEDCAAETKETAVAAVARFLRAKDLATLDLPADFDPSHVLTFRVDGVMPISLPSVQRFWAKRTAAESGTKAKRALECLVCGEVGEVEPRLPFKVKGVPKGQASGTAIISANAEAFESYGLEASLTAPTCRECAERFTKAASELLRDQGKHINVGPLAYIFWTRETEPSFSVVNVLSRPTAEEVRLLIESAWKGQKVAQDFEAEPFYAAALSASGGRVVVRDWIETTLPCVQQGLARFFRLQRIADYYGSEPVPHGIYELARATVPRTAKDLERALPPDTPRLLLGFALQGGRLPLGLLFQAVRRNRAEQGITRARAALIKMILLSWQDERRKEDYMVDLDRENHEPAYLCGRLLAVLDQIQRQAMPGIKATMIDRFFGAASSAPASVFGTLLRMSQPHLAKLRKERPPAYRALERRIEEVVYPELDSFPKTLTMQQQALFSLGYYHQRAADRAAAVAAKQANEAKATNHEPEA